MWGEVDPRSGPFAFAIRIPQFRFGFSIACGGKGLPFSFVFIRGSKIFHFRAASVVAISRSVS